MPEPLVSMRGITKFFPENGITALHNVDFTLHAGTIHALLGENGAGKSTLMQILAGFYQKDAGKIIVQGVETQYRTPAGALSCKIGMVRQRPALMPGLRVWEDCLLGAESGAHKKVSLFLPYRKAGKEQVQALNESWNFALPLDAPTVNLSAAERQLAAILALLLRDVNVLVFDEPTAVLGEADSEKLYALWQRLAKDGKAIVLISHKLEEVLKLAGEFTVLRRGNKVLAGKSNDFNAQNIMEAMFEKSEQSFVPLGKLPPADGKSSFHNKTVLEVQGLSVSEPGFPVLRNLSFTIQGGEILGVAGVKESGVETLELVIAGFLKQVVSGSIRLCGVNIAGAGPAQFRRQGGAYLGAGHKRIAGGKFIVSQDMSLSLRENLLIHAQRRLTASGILGMFKFFDPKKLKTFLEQALQQADIKRQEGEKLGALSGGMSQRLLGIRELMENPALILLAEPAWGLDRQRRTRFFRFLRERANEGRAILLFFSDLDEIFASADRILVLRNGECAENIQIDVENCTKNMSMTAIIEKRVKHAMTGVKAAV